MTSAVQLVVKYEGPFWRIMRDGKTIASLGRIAMAKSRAREIAKKLVGTGTQVVIIVKNKDGFRSDEFLVRPPAARARPVVRGP